MKKSRKNHWILDVTNEKIIEFWMSLIKKSLNFENENNIDQIHMYFICAWFAAMIVTAI